MIIIAGSCSLETEKETLKQAAILDKNNITYLRAMMLKPRTTPTSFQGVGVEEGLKILTAVNRVFPHMVFVTEIMSEKQLETLEKSSLPFVYQIGTRNAQNFGLLKELGSLKNVTFLYKRGMSMTIDEYIGGSQYLNPDQNSIWLCLRGIRTFDDSMRNTPDIGSILVLKERLCYLFDKYKIFFDPSHACGERKFVGSMAVIALIAGVDGLEIEIHSNPNEAWSDGHQTIDFGDFEYLLGALNRSTSSLCDFNLR